MTIVYYFCIEIQVQILFFAYKHKQEYRKIRLHVSLVFIQVQ